MSSVKYERLRELEVALALKQREIDVLRNTCDDCRETQKGAMGGLVDQCLSDSKCNELLANVPFEQIQNAIAQIRAQRLHEEKSAKFFDKTTHEIDLAIHEHEKEQRTLREQLEVLRDKTGLNAASAKKRVAQLEKEEAAAAKNRVEQGFAATADAGAMVTAQSRALAQSMMPLEIRVQLQQLQSEVNTAKLIKSKNEKVVQQMMAQIAKKKEVVDKKCAVLAQVQVAQRDMREAKAMLKQLVTEHEKLDHYADGVNDGTDHSCRAILDRDGTTLKGRLEECVERRRLQDRVIKAQQYRIKQLTTRLQIVQDGLERHGLAKEVEVRITEAEREAARASGSGNSCMITLPANEEEAYYDVDAIVPVDETVHPAIYSLFVTDRQKIQRRTTTQGYMVQEKTEAVESMEAKIADLSADTDKESDKLHFLLFENEKELEKMRADITEELLKQKEEYVSLVNQGRVAQSKVNNQRSRSSSQVRKPGWTMK